MYNEQLANKYSKFYNGFDNMLCTGKANMITLNHNNRTLSVAYKDNLCTYTIIDDKGNIVKEVITQNADDYLLDLLIITYFNNLIEYTDTDNYNGEYCLLTGHKQKDLKHIVDEFLNKDYINLLDGKINTCSISYKGYTMQITYADDTYNISVADYKTIYHDKDKSLLFSIVIIYLNYLCKLTY